MTEVGAFISQKKYCDSRLQLGPSHSADCNFLKNIVPSGRFTSEGYKNLLALDSLSLVSTLFS
jgi:hypothetical protein